MADGHVKGNKTDRSRVGRPFEKGNKNPRVTSPDRSGIQKGGKHSATKIREAVLDAFDAVGGEQYLVNLARSRKNRSLFIGLLGKAMPVEVTGKDGGPIQAEVLHVAVEGLSRLSDDEIAQFHGLLVKMGVHEIAVDAANEEDHTPLLEAPKVAEEARA